MVSVRVFLENFIAYLAPNQTLCECEECTKVYDNLDEKLFTEEFKDIARQVLRSMLPYSEDYHIIERY